MKNYLKHLFSAVILVFFLILAIGSGGDNNPSSDTSASSEGVNNDAGKPGNFKNVGEALTTDYFDVTVNEFTLKDKVSTGNQFADLKKEEGIRYLILNITFKNIDSESRMLSDGEILINYNGKDYKFDKSESVFVEGWGLMMDQINPLTSKTTKLVYKIPAEIKGLAYYRPGRSNKNDLISLGNIE